MGFYHYFVSRGGAQAGSLSRGGMLRGIHFFRLHSLAEFVDAVHMLDDYVSRHPRVTSLGAPVLLTRSELLEYKDPIPWYVAGR